MKFWKKQNLSNFWAVSENVLGFWHNKFGRVAKTAFHVTRTTFGVNWTFFKKTALLILLPNFSEKFQYPFKTDPPALSSPQPSRLQKLQKKIWTNQAGILHVRRSLTFRGKKSGSNQNFSTYGQWAKKWCFVGERFLAELLTTHSISSEKSFETKGFFLKKNKFDILFCSWMTKFQICGRSFRHCCQKQNPCDQRKNLIKLSLEGGTTFYFVMVFLREVWFARKLQVRQ